MVKVNTRELVTLFSLGESLDLLETNKSPINLAHRIASGGKSEEVGAGL